MSSKSPIPEIFKNAIDYRENCETMDIGQATFNEERLYLALAQFAKSWYYSRNRSASILDLCCATGLTAERIALTIPVHDIALVDIHADMLHNAKVRCSSRAAVAAYCADAVSFSTGKTFDLILMNSSYHHIEDSRKLAFLRNARSLLADDGVLLVGENFIFNYTDDRSKRQSIVRFYGLLLKALAESGEPAHSINVIRRSGLYCWEGFYEYKVHRAQFLAHARDAGLAVIESSVVWSATDDPADFAGSCALKLCKC